MQAYAGKTQNDDIIASIGTVVITGLLLLLMLWLTLSTPNPPFPEAGGGGGIELSLGNSEFGMGDVAAPVISDPEAIDRLANPAKYEQEKLVADEATNPNEADITNPETATPTPPNPFNKPTNTTNNNPTKPITNTPPTNAKNPFSKGKTGGDTKTPGDQGTANGNPNSPFGKGGSGPGSGGGNGGGIGTGTGPGNGPGSGPGTAPGTTFNLNGRSTKGGIPKPTYSSNDQGKVVVEITVDTQGNVVKAKMGRGTTVTDQNLINQAISAAKKAKFNAKDDAPDEQVGTITYVFRKGN